MSNLGSGVTRVLSAAEYQFGSVVFQSGKPPLDSEMNLAPQAVYNALKVSIARGVASGWLGNPLTCDQAYKTHSAWSNWFQYGLAGAENTPWAVVNGWMIPVTGTLTGTPPGSPDDASFWNRITLPPAPSSAGDSRTDFVFLEVWEALVAPNPSTTNKPSVSGLYRYGNVEGGWSYLPDNLQDSAIGEETTKRTQIQYRIRVVQGLVGLTSHPDGFDPSAVRARGTSTTDTSYVFENMKSVLGDPGLWRAGDGTENSLGTVDGYVYAIPLCAVFRRNTVAWDGDPGQNLNGSFNRNPLAVDRSGWKTFSATATLSADILAADLSFNLSAVANTGLATSPPSAVTVRVGDEYIRYASISGSTLTVLERGALGTIAEDHKAGTPVTVVSGRPDGLFSDQVTNTDIYDLRHVVSLNGYDYNALLAGSLDSILRGTSRANWKRSGAGPQGTFLSYQDKISASAAPLGVTKLDAPDSGRRIFSDAAVVDDISTLVHQGPGTPVSVGYSSLTWTCTSFAVSSVLTFQANSIKQSVPGSDSDQVRFYGNGVGITVKNAKGSTVYTEGVHYSVSPSNPGPNDNLTVTFLSDLTAVESLDVTVRVVYGPGRGMARRPDAVHSVAMLTTSNDTLVPNFGTPSGNLPLTVSWAPLWSKFRSNSFQGALPSTAAAYIDPGSKTVILQPFRLYDYVYRNGMTPRALAKPVGVDPLSLFTANVVDLPRALIPGWGEVKAPILPSAKTPFSQGINYLLQAPEGATTVNSGLVAYNNGATSSTYFTTRTFISPTSASFNSLVPGGPCGQSAGIRFFTDTRNLGRKGLQFPPGYGLARVFGVYAYDDYVLNGSPFSTVNRVPDGTGAKNLLRQTVGNKPTLWVEPYTEGAGGYTYVLNAEALDVSRAGLATFESGNYVVEASIFCFSAGFFDLSQAPSLYTTSPNPSTVAVASLVVPLPAGSNSSVVVNYSRTPYQGDAWGSQTNQTDIQLKQGPISSGTLFTVSSSSIDLTALTRPNEKALQVLATLDFVTTLGTGRIAGDVVSSAIDFRNSAGELYSPGYPSSGVDARPSIVTNALGSSNPDITTSLGVIGTEYHGCTERLPLGAMFRDKDFRGHPISGNDSSAYNYANRMPFVYVAPTAGSCEASLIQESESNLGVFNRSTGTSPGEVLVHVDGEQGNYNLLSNFRTNRGGSAYVGSGYYPGGEVTGQFMSVGVSSSTSAVLAGKAFLVKNGATNLGATQVSPGSEIMVLIATTAARYPTTGSLPLKVLIGTNGSGEGYSAADLYRVSGHPLDRDTVTLTGITPPTLSTPVN